MFIVSISDPPQSLDGDADGPIFDVDQEVGELLCRRPDLWRPATEEEALKFASPAKKTAAAKKTTPRQPAKKASAKPVAKKPAPAKKTAAAKP